MRVLHLLKTSDGARWALLQVRELAKLGVDVHVALPAGGAHIAAYRRAGATLHCGDFDAPTRQPWRLPEISARLRDLVRSVEPDLIHSHFVGTTLVMRLALGKRHPTPRLFQVPGPLHLESRLFRSLDLGTAGTHDYWCASCQWTKDEYIRRGVPPDRVSLAYYGTDLAMYEGVERGAFRSELGLAPETPLVGMVALMYKPKWVLGQTQGIKGHEDFIDALAICLGRGADIVGLCVGGPFGKANAYEKHLRRYGNARCGDRLVFTGTVPNDKIPGIYSDLDLAVAPSHSDNCGGAGESMIMGVPTVATSVGGFPDLVRPGMTGWLVPPKCPGKLADAMLEALEDRQHARVLGRNGRARARELFDVTRTADLLDTYRHLCSAGPASCGGQQRNSCR